MTTTNGLGGLGLGQKKPAATDADQALANKLGVDQNEPATQEQLDEAAKLAADLSEANASRSDIEGILNADGLIEPEDGRVAYTSHPITNYKIGDFQFDKGQLFLTPEDAEKFDELLNSLPPVERVNIRKVDVAAGERFAKAFLESRSVRGVDTSTNTPDATTE